MRPDCTHANLPSPAPRMQRLPPARAYRYTPDVFERDGVADGAKVPEWKNVAQICYQGFRNTVAETADANDAANDCTYAKKGNTQAVAGGNTRHVEALKQENVHHQPIYKKNALNGHGEKTLLCA